MIWAGAAFPPERLVVRAVARVLADVLVARRRLLSGVSGGEEGPRVVREEGKRVEEEKEPRVLGDDVFEDQQRVQAGGGEGPRVEEEKGPRVLSGGERVREEVDQRVHSRQGEDRELVDDQRMLGDDAVARVEEGRLEAEGPQELLRAGGKQAMVEEGRRGDRELVDAQLVIAVARVEEGRLEEAARRVREKQRRPPIDRHRHSEHAPLLDYRLLAPSPEELLEEKVVREARRAGREVVEIELVDMIVFLLPP
ncbi:hypothetical protein T484DRAFT_1888377 [Baffinella frigidus]|nr:hypothetical protein T484DRAFT_1888377 [Cryptophyta sp. CCMP2293]